VVDHLEWPQLNKFFAIQTALCQCQVSSCNVLHPPCPPHAFQAQFSHVEFRTSNNYTYNMGSHVMAYGNLDLAHQEHTGSYIGTRDCSE
jgi:hypothetical protein